MPGSWYLLISSFELPRMEVIQISVDDQLPEVYSSHENELLSQLCRNVLGEKRRPSGIDNVFWEVRL